MSRLCCSVYWVNSVVAIIVYFCISLFIDSINSSVVSSRSGVFCNDVTNIMILSFWFMAGSNLRSVCLVACISSVLEYEVFQCSYLFSPGKFHVLVICSGLSRLWWISFNFSCEILLALFVGAELSYFIVAVGSD